MITIVTPDKMGKYSDIVADMFRLRRRVFADALNWDVITVGDFEIDKY
jgi:acyl homoserine lactone synthase